MRSHGEEMLTGEKPHCPQCDGIELRRQGRIGFLQRAVFPRMGLFPWECGLCRKVFFLKQRSTAYRQHITEPVHACVHPEFPPPPAVILCRPSLGAAFKGEHAS